MNTFKLPFLLCLSVFLVIGASCQSTSRRESAKPAAPWYENEISAFEQADLTSPPATGQVLFIGSSSIRMWKTLAEDMAPMPVLNRGFGGSKTAEVLAVFDRLVLPYAPSIIVYYCGDNDLGTDNTDAQAAADGFITFAQRVHEHWTGVPVFYIATKPSLARWNNWAAMAQANMIVRSYAKQTPGVEFLDIATPMLTPRGPDPMVFLNDGLHLNDAGYEIWTEVVRPPVLAEWQRLHAE